MIPSIWENAVKAPHLSLSPRKFSPGTSRRHESDRNPWRQAMARSSTRAKAVFFATMTLIASLSISESSSIGDDPAAIQQRAIQRIDGFVDRFRKTGDRTALLADLRQAEVELATSYEVLLRRRKPSSSRLEFDQARRY